MTISVSELIYWASLGNLAQVEAVLQKDPDVNAAGADGYTAVHASAENGHVAILNLLLARGANLNGLACGFTPLDLATNSSNDRKSAMIELLTRLGAARRVT